MKLSVSMIVKNEESCLEKCLNSVAGADEIVIVDTGSEDSTLEIAKRHTDKVSIFTECNDENGLLKNFSAARNNSLSKCSGDWILIIDADEILEDGGIIKIRKFLETVKNNCVYFESVAINNHVVKHPSIRLFKNNSGIYWTRRIHNVLNVTVGDISDIKIYYGYSEAHKKDPDRALRILKSVVEEEPLAKRERYYLAREYWYRRDYKTAIDHYLEYLKVAVWWPEIADAYLMLARCYWITQEGGKAREACLQAIRQNPDFKEALLFMSELHHEPWKSKWKHIADSATNKDVLFVRR